MNEKSILITASGADTPGITAKLAELISTNQGEILDIGQSVLNGFLSLSILVSMNQGKELLKDILFEGKKLGLTIDFSVVDLMTAQQSDQDQHSYVISCVSSEKISAQYIADFTKLLAEKSLNIQQINKTSHSFQSLDIVCRSQALVSWEQLKEKLVELSHSHQIDVAFQKNDLFRWNKRLIVFDMDSTLIQTEVINEIAAKAGVKDKVEEITERAMNGELDFSESLKERVSLLEGLSEDFLEEIAQSLPITPGVELLIASVKKLGYKLAVISGGFTYFANHLKKKLDLDYAFANELEIQDGKLTGKVTGTIVDAEQKAFLLNLIAQQESISLEQTVAVGDGANDLPMLKKAGLGVAFFAKPYVRQRAQQQIGQTSMESLLHFLGISR